MDEQKVKVVIELDKACVQSAMYLMGEKLTDELWDKLTQGEVALSTDPLDGDSKQRELGIACLAIAEVLQEEE